MLLTEFFTTKEGDSNAKFTSTSPTTEGQCSSGKASKSRMVGSTAKTVSVKESGGNYEEIPNRRLRNEDPFIVYDHTMGAVILTSNSLEEATKEAVEWAEYDDITVSVIKKATKRKVITIDGYSGAMDYYEQHGELDESQQPDGVDTITVDVPLMIRLLEYAHEDAQTDMDLHHVAENLIELSHSGRTLSMQDYNKICNTKESN